MFKSKATVLVLTVAALVIVATPIAIAAKNSDDVSNDSKEYDLVTIRGNVTAFLYDDEWENDTDDNEDLDEMNEKEKTHEVRVCAFVLDNETVVTFGPWWYWLVQKVNVTDIVRVGDFVNVTGELEEEDGVSLLCAWYIGNETTGKDLTIREEGRPPWAGGPKALGIDPWPPSDEDE